jgi:hypothetical protein
VVAAEARAMIATRRGLAILLAIACVLAVLVVLDARRTGPGSLDRALLPGLDVDRLTALTWQRPGQPAVKLVKDHDQWRWTEPVAAVADPRAVGDVLAALRAARWHRTAAAVTAAPVHAELTIGPPSRTIGIGKTLEGAEQTWLVDGDRALLVDRWVAHALDPDPLSLRIRRPFENASAAKAIAITGAGMEVRLHDQPRRLTMPLDTLVAPSPIASLERALAAIEIIRLPNQPVPDPRGISIDIDGEVWVLELTPRQGCLHLVGPSGDGCVDPASRDALVAAARPLATADVSVVEPRPAPVDPIRITLRDGSVIDLQARLQIGGRDADPARVAELLAVLAAPAEVIDTGEGAPLGQLVIEPRSGSRIALNLRAGNVVQRAGERHGLRLTPAAFAMLTRPASQLLDPQLWIEEPTSISALAIDGVTYAASGGTWTRTPAGRFDPASITQLAGLLAAPRAIAAISPEHGGFTRRHDVTVTITPPIGAPIVHTLELGAPRRAKDGCRARTGGLDVTLRAAICALADELAR